MRESFEDTSQPATEALVFMVVAVNGSWKLAIGYFFIAHLQSEDKEKLIKTCLNKLYDIKVNVISITCDCPTTNWSTLKRLGACFEPDDMKCWFPHPSDEKIQIAVILDPCHLIKLIRNTLSDFSTIFDSNGNSIR
jgi:DNA transposase THAP9